MPAFIQDVLDLIEWANGPVTSTWGAKRAAAGHPEPFGLEYLGVGNEDHITPGFRERFKMIFDAVKAKHPEIIVIGTAGPNHSGPDYEAGWAFGRELRVPVVDEHYYVKPEWFWDNLNFYDRYERGAGEVYLGEYAAHDTDKRSTLRAAVAEAAYMTAMERNGDVVRLCSYAPLLARRGNTQWTPDLIYFDNNAICLTPSYFVQQMFAQHAGDEYLQTSIDGDSMKLLAASTVRDGRTGDVIVKIVSRSDRPIHATIDLSALGMNASLATCIVLTGDADAVNTLGESPAVSPVATTLNVSPRHEHELPPHSVTVLRIPAK
jgi:alpha-L-arabinofuranosidase